MCFWNLQNILAGRTRSGMPLLTQMRLPGPWYLSNRKSKDANKNKRYGVGVSTMTLLDRKVVEVAR